MRLIEEEEDIIRLTDGTLKEAAEFKRVLREAAANLGIDLLIEGNHVSLDALTEDEALRLMTEVARLAIKRMSQ